VPRVVIVQRVLAKYREAFYEGLREALAHRNIDLEFIHGIGSAEEHKREILGEVKWAKVIPEKYFSLPGATLVLQPYMPFLKGANIVVTQQEIRWVLNYKLMARHGNGYKLAFWGHGLNKQENPRSLANIFKKNLINRADWWFAYTEGVGRFLQSAGFPAEKITVVQNAIDTNELFQLKQSISRQELEDSRQELGILQGAPVGLFCGSLYQHKRIDFFLEACLRIKEKVPAFHAIIIGAGPLREMVEAYAAKAKWLHYRGAQFGREKVKSFMLADCFLMPGMVGLSIIDSFVFEAPIMTTTYPGHSPEIEYLKEGHNGLVSQDNVEAYAQMVAWTLQNVTQLTKLKQGCRESASVYTMEKMVNNFADGLQACLKS
jgi:glycosyltransferase involved in cell wall biosynthesis